MISGERRKLVTVAVTINALENSIPPFFCSSPQTILLSLHPRWATCIGRSNKWVWLDASRGIFTAPFQSVTVNVQRALRELLHVGGTAERWSFSRVKWVAHIRLHYPLFVLQAGISLVRFSMLKEPLSLKEHSRVGASL